VIDRFHVTRSYRDGVDEFRKSELKRLKEAFSEEIYLELKGSLWACRKKYEDLRPEERKVRKLLFEHAPQLKLAYGLQTSSVPSLINPFRRRLPRPVFRLGRNVSKPVS
jgi:hypothetical protein